MSDPTRRLLKHGRKSSSESLHRLQKIAIKINQSFLCFGHTFSDIVVHSKRFTPSSLCLTVIATRSSWPCSNSNCLFIAAAAAAAAASGDHRADSSDSVAAGRTPAPRAAVPLLGAAGGRGRVLFRADSDTTAIVCGASDGEGWAPPSRRAARVSGDAGVCGACGRARFTCKPCPVARETARVGDAVICRIVIQLRCLPPVHRQALLYKSSAKFTRFHAVHTLSCCEGTVSIYFAYTDRPCSIRAARNSHAFMLFTRFHAVKAQ